VVRRSQSSVAARVAAPGLAALLDRHRSDQERHKRIEPPRTKEGVAEESD
jgi:hypothetical protein